MENNRFEPSRYARFYVWFFYVSALNYLVFLIFPGLLDTIIGENQRFFPPFSLVPAVSGMRNGAHIIGFEAFFFTIYVQFFITFIALVFLLLRRIIALCLPSLGWTVEKASTFGVIFLFFAAGSYSGPLNAQILSDPNPRVSGIPLALLSFFASVFWLMTSLMSVVTVIEPGHVNRNFKLRREN